MTSYKKMLCAIALLPALCALSALDISALMGAYTIEVDTPMGHKQGHVIAELDDAGGFFGMIHIFDNDNDFYDGVAHEDGSFSFSGKLRYHIFKISYTVTGQFYEGHIEAVARTRVGNMKITGVRVDAKTLILDARPDKKKKKG